MYIKLKLIVRDRPFERTITMQKDSSGHVGFQVGSLDLYMVHIIWSILYGPYIQYCINKPVCLVQKW